MSMIYNVLWIDDEWDKMTTFQQECEEIHGLHLEPFRTRKAGMEAFERDIDHWDAILLDAKMFDEGENEVAKLVGLRKAIQRLDELALKRTIPRFISTGQTDLMSDENFKDSFGDFYKKGEDDVKLINDMLEAINNSDNMQVKKIYQDVFCSLKDLGIAKYTESILTDILTPMHFPADEPYFKPVYHYNQLRLLIEYLFRACNKVGLIPDQCVFEGKLNLNQSSLYLAGKNAEVIGIRYGKIGERIIPDYIESIIRSVLEFGNIHSHTVELSEEDTQKIEKILKSAKSRFIIYGLTLQLCEAIIWFAEYIKQHNDIEENLWYCTALYNVGEEYNGREIEPLMDENGIWHCDECVVAIHNWTPGKKIRLKDVQLNTNYTKDGYPYFARFDKI